MVDKEQQESDSTKPALGELVAVFNNDYAEDNCSSQPATSSPAAGQSSASTEEAAVGNADENNEPATESILLISDDDNDEDTDNVGRMLRPPRTRFYTGWEEIEHESTSPASLGDSDNLSRSPVFLDDIEHESGLAGILDDNENESRSPPFLDESSLDSSVAFWNRYYTSSNEDADSVSHKFL